MPERRSRGGGGEGFGSKNQLRRQALSNAFEKSRSRSRQSSTPTEIRTSPSPIPAVRRSSGDISEGVVVAGWHASDSTPPKLTAFRAMVSRRRKSNAAGLPPSSS